jgi:Leucine-rich repeat (LRR) protein
MIFTKDLLESIQTATFREACLDLNGQEIGDQGCISLLEALKNNKHIKKVNLGANNIGDEGIVDILSLTTLEEIDLSENNITQVGAEILSKIQSKKLIINNNPIGDMGIQHLSANKRILDLHAAGCDITATGAQDILKKNNTLKKLDLSENLLSDEGVATISFNDSLEEFVASRTGIGEIGATYISKNKALQMLDLSDNHVGNRGATVLISHPSLKVLNLGKNEISDAGIEAFLYNNQLEGLILFENKITKAGLLLLLKNSSLFFINVYQNPIYLLTSKEVEDSLFTTSDLRSFTRKINPTKMLEVDNNVLPSSTHSPVIPNASLSENSLSSSRTPLIMSQFNTLQERNSNDKNAKRKADEMISHPDFSDFFHSASGDDIRLFFESLKENCKEIFRNKQKIKPVVDADKKPSKFAE